MLSHKRRSMAIKENVSDTLSVKPQSQKVAKFKDSVEIKKFVIKCQIHNSQIPEPSSER